MRPYWEPASCRSPVKTPAGSCLPHDQAVPFAGDAPRTEAEAVLLETLRLEEMERRRRSLRTEPLVLSYRNSDPGADAAAAAGAQLPDALSEAGTGRPGHSPGRPSRRHRRQAPSARAGDFLALLTELNDRELAATAAARAAGGRLSPVSCPGAA